MGKTYKRERTVNKQRRSHVIELRRRSEMKVLDCEKEMGVEDWLEFIECCNAVKSFNKKRVLNGKPPIEVNDK